MSTLPVILHVEDKHTYVDELSRRFDGRAIYRPYPQLPNAAAELSGGDVDLLMVDLRLGPIDPRRFVNWGRYAPDLGGFLEKARDEHPDVERLVLTNYAQDKQIDDLIRGGLVRRADVFSKAQEPIDAFAARVIARAEQHRIAKVDSDRFLPATIVPLSAEEAIDPTLLRALHRPGGAPEDLISVLVSVRDPELWLSCADVVEPRVFARAPDGTGHMASGRVARSKLLAVRRSANVISMEASRPISKLEYSCFTARVPDRKENTDGVRGRGVVVGVIDCGINIAHPNFLKSVDPKRTRLNALLSRGKTYYADALDRHLAGLELIDYDPRGELHGTHVLDIAAGNGRGSGTLGVAPEAELIFADVQDSLGSDEGTVEVVHAATAIFDLARGRPCVINVSLGLNRGPHDGTSKIEHHLDALAQEKKNRAIVVAAGNRYAKNLHARATLEKTGDKVSIEMSKNEDGVLDLEAWYAAPAVVRAAIYLPHRDRPFLELPLSTRGLDPSRPWLEAAHHGVSEDHPKRDRFLQLLIGRSAPPGVWRVELTAVSDAPCVIDAWLEEHPFRAEFMKANRECTITAFACGAATIVVGAFHHRTLTLADFSSAGRTRDGRMKPDLVAPGCEVAAAHAYRVGDRYSASGTSQAAPLVTGIIALLFEEASRRGLELSAGEIRELLIASAAQKPAEWSIRRGFGNVDATAALAALRGRSA